MNLRPEACRIPSAAPSMPTAGYRLRLWALGALAASLLAIACAGAEPSKAALEARVAEFWNCKVKGDNVRLYEFFEPAYREQTSLQDFLPRFAGFAVYDGFEIESVEISGSEATAFVTYRWHMSPEITRGVQAPVKTVPRYSGEWVWIDGEWYRKGPESGEPVADLVGGRREESAASETKQEAGE